METIAVYWEPKPKTYGFREAARLSLLSIAVKPEKMAQWGRCFMESANSGIDFHLVLSKHSNSEECRLYLLLEKPSAGSLLSHIGKQVALEPGKDFSLTFPVELISFQGPHFGDRYGIAEAAFKALDDNGIPILIAACSGAAVYIVLTEKKLQQARSSLAAAFTVP
jgi:aspartokinase